MLQIYFLIKQESIWKIGWQVIHISLFAWWWFQDITSISIGSWWLSSLYLSTKKSYKLEQIWQFYRISLLKRKQASTSEEHAVGFEVSFDCFSELSLLVVLSGESPSLSPTFSSESDLLDAGTHLAHSSRLRIFSPYKSTRTSCYDQTDMSD